MTRPNRDERMREAWTNQSCTRVATRVTWLLRYEDALRGARRCRDNAARYRRERDAALRDLDAVRAELADLRKHELAVSEVSGIVYEADGHNSEPGPRDTVLESLREHKRARLDEQELRWRVETLQEELASIKARRCGTCRDFDHECNIDPEGDEPCNLPRGQGWCDTFNVQTYAVMSCPDWKGGE